MLGVVQPDIVEDKILLWEGEKGKFKQIGSFGNKWERVISKILTGRKAMLFLEDFAAAFQVGLEGICGCALFLLGWEIFTRSLWRQQTQQTNLFCCFNSHTSSLLLQLFS